MARPQAPCGTLAAYKRHLRNGEKPDVACVQANRDVKRGQRDAARKLATTRVGGDDLREGAAVQGAEVVEPPASEPSAKTDLKMIRDALVDAIEAVKATDPSRLAPLVRELRETWKAMQDPAEPDGRADEDEFARARAARAARKAGA